MSSQRGQRIWKLYEWAVILGGAAAAVLLSWLFSGQVKQQADILLFLGILPLYVIFDLIRLPYGDQVLSLGFPVVLFALMGSRENGPLIVAEIVTLGSLCSESLRLLFKRQLLDKFDRVAFYAAHHALAALAAMTAFDLAHDQQVLPLWLATEALDPFLDPSYVLAVAGYVVVYSLVSSMLVAPHDWGIRGFQLPMDEERLPRVHPVGSVLLMAPVPVALYVLGFALTGTGQLILSLVFPALFLAFLILARSYVRIERETIIHRDREEVRCRLHGLTRFNKELLDSVSALVARLLKTPGRYRIAVYTELTNDGTLWLRGERARWRGPGSRGRRSGSCLAVYRALRHLATASQLGTRDTRTSGGEPAVPVGSDV